jgi:crotonobetainyl-CoA:carnitine CoA-transferase CaiB-like acyl-CoA transferase
MILMGLWRKLRTGQSTKIIGPQLTSTLFATSEVILTPDNKTIFDFQIDKDQTGPGPLYRLYQTSDDWICIAVVREKDWKALTSIPGFQQLAADGRFGKAELRERNAEALAQELGSRFKQLTAADAFKALDGMGVPCEIPRKPYAQEYLWDQENIESGRVVEYTHPVFGKERAIGQTVHLSETPGKIKGTSPVLGQHTREILAELGYTPEQIADFKKRGIVNWEEVAKTGKTAVGAR